MIHFIIGLAAGGFGGLVGLGGGVIMIPLMVGWLKMKQHVAHGTSLVVLVFTGLSGALTYMAKGSVEVFAAVLLAATAIFTARFGANYAGALPEWKLKRYFGVLMLVVTVLLMLKSYPAYAVWFPPPWLKVCILLIIGAVTGFLSGLLGVGGGSIMVPAMVLGAGFTQYTAQGSSLLAMVPIGLVGAYTHWHLGNVRTDILPGLIPGALLGSFLGAFFAHNLPEPTLRAIFAVVLVWTGVKYLRAAKPKPVSPIEPDRIGP